MTLKPDDYDYNGFADDETDNYDATLAEWQAAGWEPYDGERDDGGAYITRLRRPRWIGQLIERVQVAERERWADEIEEEYLWPAQRDGKTEIAEVLTQIVSKLRDQSSEGD